MTNKQNRTVVEIIDGDTFRVSPEWNLGNATGDRVRPTGYNTPEKGEAGYQEAKDRLGNLILDKVVTLSNPIKITRGRLLCDVFIDGKYLADFFPDFLTD